MRDFSPQVDSANSVGVMVRSHFIIRAIREGDRGQSQPSQPQHYQDHYLQKNLSDHSFTLLDKQIETLPTRSHLAHTSLPNLSLIQWIGLPGEGLAARLELLLERLEWSE